MTQGRPRSARPALAAGLLALVSTAGCGTGPVPVGAAPPSASASQGAGGVGLLAERHTWGGMCAEGPCRSDLVVRADGSWVLQTEGGTAEGMLAAHEFVRLEEAVAGTGLADGVVPATGCAADHDGTSVEYVWLAQGAQPQIASSCEQVVVTDDPLVLRLDAIAADITP